MLFTEDDFTVFKSSWRVWCSKIPYNNGWIIPLGWETELTARGISFTVIEIIPEEDENLTLP